jgi:DNA-directed RNA polymerase subunit delta
MEEIKEIDAKLPEVDVAYQILKHVGEGKNLRELIHEVFGIKGISVDPQKMAAVHTEITLDSRFNFLGQGNWGLKEWTQGKIVRRNISHASVRNMSFAHRRSLTDEIEYEDKEFTEKLEGTTFEEDEGWEE